MWALAHGFTSFSRPSKTYINQLGARTAFSLKDLLTVMGDRVGWQRESKGFVLSVWLDDIYLCVFVYFSLCLSLSLYIYIYIYRVLWELYETYVLRSFVATLCWHYFLRTCEQMEKQTSNVYKKFCFFVFVPLPSKYIWLLD